MRTYRIAQELYSVLCGDLNEKEIQKRGRTLCVEGFVLTFCPFGVLALSRLSMSFIH